MFCHTHVCFRHRSHSLSLCSVPPQAHFDESEDTPPEDDELLAPLRELEQAQQEESDTEPDAGAPPRGAGLVGRGAPLHVGKGRRRRLLQDGGGLCSPGLWPPARRPAVRAPEILALRAALSRALQDTLRREDATAAQFFDKHLARGCSTSPFPPPLVAELREYAHQLFGDESRRVEGERDKNVRVRLLYAVLGSAGDPDVHARSWYLEGVRIGVGQRLPRTPAVFERRRAWRLAEQYDPDVWRQAFLPSEWRDNYASAADHAAEVERQLEDHHASGLALRFEDEAAVRARWPHSVVASLGTIAKHAEDGSCKLRLLFDATHGVGLNNRIRVRDKERGPATADIKRVMRAQAEEGSRVVGMVADVKDAHRTVPVHEDDWAFQLCRAHPGGRIYAFRCGVFGVASISYWWARLASAVLRAVHYMMDVDADLWALLVADDFKFEAGGSRAHFDLLYVVLLLDLLSVPLAWPKLRGGTELEWVGYHLLLREASIGLSASRASWVVTWCRRMAQTGAAQRSHLREGLGRLSFVAGAMELERPFLSPLFAHVAVLRTEAVKPLPMFVRLMLTYIADRVERRRHYSCGTVRPRAARAPRVDAKAEQEEIGIGGWLPTEGPDGRISRARSPWFSFRLCRRSAPWAYSKSGEPYRAISALEGIAALMSVKLFAPWFRTGERGTIIMPGTTDNQGNMYALTKLMTSRYPSCCVLMELAATLDDLDMRFDLNWTPRDFNQEADALSNSIYTGFSEDLRIHVDPHNFSWHVLDTVMELGRQFYAERAAAPPPAHRPPQHKRRRADRLREKDPW